MFQLHLTSVRGQRGGATLGVSSLDEALDVLRGVIESVPGAKGDDIEVTRYNGPEGRSTAFASVNGPYLTGTVRATLQGL